MKQDFNYKVCTRCFTFNHAPYIRDTMDGFTIQQTNFSFACVVVDDNSTDGEQEVIRKYLAENFKTPYRTEETDDFNLICADHNNNPNCTFIVFLLKYNHYSIKKSKFPYFSEWFDNAKYHALCEGDDHWIDENKLQMQVNLLESNNDVVACGGGYKSIRNCTKISESCIKKLNQPYFVFDINEWSDGWLLKTLTVMYRQSAWQEYLKVADKYKYARDIHLFYHLMKQGKGIYISHILGAYNIHEGSACSTVPKAQNALYGYQCNRELWEFNQDEVTRRRLLKSINSRLVNKMPKQNTFGLFKEGIVLSKTLKELSHLVYHFLFGKTALLFKS